MFAGHQRYLCDTSLEMNLNMVLEIKIKNTKPYLKNKVDDDGPNTNAPRGEI